MNETLKKSCSKNSINFKIFNARKLKQRCKSETAQKPNKMKKCLVPIAVQEKTRRQSDITLIHFTPYAKCNRRVGLIKKNSISLDCLNNNISKSLDKMALDFSVVAETPRENDATPKKTVRSQSTTGLKIDFPRVNWLKELGSKAHLKIKRNLETLLSKESHLNESESFFTKSMLFLNKDSILIKKQQNTRNKNDLFVIIIKYTFF